MTVPLTDTHCHLSHCEGDAERILSVASEMGVTRVVDVGMGLAEAQQTVERAEVSGGRVLAAVGLHPNDLSDWRSDPRAAMARLSELASSPAVVAIGESGIDTYRERESPSDQEASFRAHVDLAKRSGKALVIHCRDAHDEVIRVLDDAGPPPVVVMHCFSGGPAHATACVERGFYCSFAGNITYSKADDLRESALAVPEDLLLVETDAPYLAPVPHRGKPNHPGLVRHTADALADLRGTDASAFRAVLRANTERAFGGERPFASTG